MKKHIYIQNAFNSDELLLHHLAKQLEYMSMNS